jgi:hypothetical protein
MRALVFVLVLVVVLVLEKRFFTQPRHWSAALCGRSKRLGRNSFFEDEDDDEYEDDKHASSRPYADTHPP